MLNKKLITSLSLSLLVFGWLIVNKAPLARAEVERENESEQFEDDYFTPTRAATTVSTPIATGFSIQNTPTVTVTATPIITSQQIQTTVTSSSQPNKQVPWPWYLTRSAGIVSYLLLVALSILGIGLSTNIVYRIIDPIKAWIIHRSLGIALAATILLHILGLLVDTYLKFSLADVFIPFAASYRPIYTSLGIIGFYLFAGVLATSLFYISKAAWWWRVLHYLAFPAAIMIFLHGIYTGTDTQTWWMQFIYWSTGISMLGAVVYRFIDTYYLNQRLQNKA